MKKKLLSLVAMALVAIGISAQTWTAPAPPTQEAVDYVADGTTPYYLYNVECGEFVTGANSWATQISLGTGHEAYMQVVVEPMTEEEEEIYPGAVKLKLNGTFYFTGGNNRTNYKVENTYLFRDSETSGFIDHASQAVWYWNFEKAESGNYYWHSAYYMGGFDAENQFAQGTGSGEGVVFNATAEASGIEWQFISVESISEEATKLYTARLELYNLAKLIVDEELDKYGVSYEEYTEVYNGTDIDAIKAATEELSAKVVEGRKAKAFGTGTEDNPSDVTFLLTNPNFTGNADGWTVDVPGAQNKGYQGATYTNDLDDAETNPNFGVKISGFIEAWVPGKGLGDGKIYQTVELPLGKYVLGVDVMATNQYTSSDAREDATGFQLYALGGGIDNGVEVKSYNGKPEHYEFEFITAGGTTELGLRMVDAQGNWFGADNFTVFYKGNDVDPFYIALPALVASCQEIDVEGMKMNKDVRDAFVAALTAAATEAEITDGTGNYEAVYKALMDAKEAMEASVAAYQRLEAFIERVNADQEAYSDVQSISDALSERATTYSDGYEDEVATTEQIDEWIAAYDELLLGLVKAAMPDATEENPVRISILGKNLDYANNEKEPWECSSSAYKVNYHNGEVWQASFSCLQTIADLPAGKYIVKAKAFYRDAPNAEHYDNYQVGEANITTYLVANSNKVKVPALALAAVESEVQPEGTYYAETTEGSGIWMPNSQQSAEWAFNNTDFFNCEVSTYLVNDGELVFGTRNDEIESANNQWSVWTQFDIYYAGKSQSALYDQLVAITDQATEMQDNPIYSMVEEGLNKLNEAISAAEAATLSTPEAELTALIDQLNAAIAYAEEGYALAIRLTQELLPIYSDKYNNEAIESSDEVFPGLMEAIGAAHQDESFESNEQIQGWIDQLAQAWVNYVMGQDLTGASEEEPIDITAVLFNADFEAEGNSRGATPSFWTVDALGQNNGFQNNNVYTNEETGITLSNFVESWKPSGALADGQISQTLGGTLPVGFYRLEADGKSNTEVGVYLMATDGAESWTTVVTNSNPDHYAVDIKSDGEKVLTIGVLVKETTSNWIAFDNFQLFYIGQTAPNAVEGVAADAANQPVVIYNLAGQRVSKAVRGLYIINGKKVVIK